MEGAWGAGAHEIANSRVVKVWTAGPISALQKWPQPQRSPVTTQTIASGNETIRNRNLRKEDRANAAYQHHPLQSRPAVAAQYRYGPDNPEAVSQAHRAHRLWRLSFLRLAPHSGRAQHRRAQS